MAAQKSPFLGVNYGWSLGEDSWNVGMDDNLRQFSALLYKVVDGIVTDVPAMNSGQMYYSTLDNTINYNIDGITYRQVVPVGFSFTDKVTGISYKYDGNSVSPEFSQSSGDSRYVLQSSTTPFSLTLLAASTAAASRGVLGLGTASTQATGFFEPAITAGTNVQFWRGDKTFQDLGAFIRSNPLTGLSLASSTPITAADTTLSGFGKLQGQVTLKAPLASPALTGIPTAPTASAGTNTDQIATTAFVAAASASTAVSAIAPIKVKTDRTLAPSATHPVKRDDGSDLQVGDSYPNTVKNDAYFWNGAEWNSSAQQLEAALAAPSGATKLGVRRSKLGEDIGTLSSFLSAQPRNIYEFLEYVTDRPGVSPDTWDWTRATIEAAKLGGIIEFPDGVYTYRPTTQYFADGATRICAVRFGSDTLVRFSPNTKIVSRDNDTAFDYREIFLAMGASNTVFSGGGLFDGGLLPDASNVAALPKVGITIRASSWCEIVDLRAQDFAYHGFAAYASEVGGCSDVTFRRLVSKRGRASSIIMYSSVANAGHAPNRRMRVIDCEGSGSGQFFGLELRGCADFEVSGGSYYGNVAGGINLEENSRDGVVFGSEVYNNAQGVTVSGNQGACPDITFENCNIHNNSGSQVSNFAGPRMKLKGCQIKDGGSIGVNILVPTTLPVADGVEIIETVIAGNASTGFLSRGSNARINGSTIISNGGADIQVSNDGLRHQNSVIGVFAYDNPSRQVAGTSLTASSIGATLKILGRLGVDEERSRLVGASETGTDFGSLEFVRQGVGSGRIEVYGYLSNTRKLLATFTRDGDVQLATSSRGLIVQAPNNTRWRIRVDNSGAIVTESVA